MYVWNVCNGMYVWNACMSYSVLANFQRVLQDLQHSPFVFRQPHGNKLTPVFNNAVGNA